MSFTCKDDSHISDGTRIEECVYIIEENPQILAIGINCTAPRYVSGLINKIIRTKTTKRIIVYPNSGERFDPELKVWSGVQSTSEFGQLATEWYKAGARMIGGCCRTGPEHIKAIKNALIECPMPKSK
jgi:homocysteine S-methyltransferase